MHAVFLLLAYKINEYQVSTPQRSRNLHSSLNHSPYPISKDLIGTFHLQILQPYLRNHFFDLYFDARNRYSNLM